MERLLQCRHIMIDRLVTLSLTNWRGTSSSSLDTSQVVTTVNLVIIYLYNQPHGVGMMARGVNATSPRLSTLRLPIPRQYQCPPRPYPLRRASG